MTAAAPRKWDRIPDAIGGRVCRGAEKRGYQTATQSEAPSARSLKRWQTGVKDLRRRMILAQTPWERWRWYAILLLAQG